MKQYDKPRIAVILDENTSSGSTRYEAAKGYFKGIHAAGGSPYGIPYFADMAPNVIRDFDGLLAVGGRFAYPDTWYQPGHASQAPPSERFAVERAIMAGFLERDKPVLGICAGMQMLACLHGGLLTPDLKASHAGALDHDGGALHDVRLAAGSRLAALIGEDLLQVNSFHREAVAECGPRLVASAVAADGVIEAVECPGLSFAVGLQWHQERLVETPHAGNRIFQGFVAACARKG